MSGRVYLVTGVHPVCGQRPGTVFTADLPESQEAALIAGGGLELARGDWAERHDWTQGDPVILDDKSKRKRAKR